MDNKKQFWIKVALFNLCIVALLGVTLRSKILFPIQGIDFTYILQAHSHFAFEGWITLAIITLLIYEILPGHFHKKKSYQWLLLGIFFNAWFMLISFVFQGYNFFSLLFFLLFVITTFIFSFVYIKDLLGTETDISVKILSISAVLYLVLSSVGPFTLIYLMATHSTNNLFYRDSTYTYLHMQYNGFFALSVFALFINCFYRHFNQYQLIQVRRFAVISSFTIIPSLFISYLWHYPDLSIKIAAIIGCIFIGITIYQLLKVLNAIKDQLSHVPAFARKIGFLSIIAFILKSLLQTGTIIPSLGNMVYGDRAIIIGFLHLVLLGFISLYLLSHLLYKGLLPVTFRTARLAVIIFTLAIIANEVILMIQGFGNMLRISNSMYTWLLWGISIWLFTGACLILFSILKKAPGSL